MTSGLVMPAPIAAPPRSLTYWIPLGAAAVVAVVALSAALRVVPLYDAIETVIEPMLRHGSDYFGGAPGRMFFRPIEYYLNLGAERLGAPWVVLWVVALGTAATAAGLAILADPGGDSRSAHWRWLTAALIFAHPLVLPAMFQYDRVSQVLANLAGVLALLCAAARPDAVFALLGLHVFGLASKESYAAFLVASSGLAAWQLLRSARYGRLGVIVLGGLVLVAGYAWLHAQGTNAALLAATPRYQLGIGVNVLRNAGLFIAGTLFLGSTGEAAEGFSWAVAAWLAASFIFWTTCGWVTVRGRVRTPGDEEPVFLRCEAPLLLGVAASLVPSVLTQDVSENNASCFAAFVVALAMAALRLATARVMAAPLGGPAGHELAARLLPLGLVVGAVASASGAVEKLGRIAVTSADARFMASQASQHAGAGRIAVDCRYVPHRRYSIYHMPSSALVGWMSMEMKARGTLAEDDVVSCASGSATAASTMDVQH